MYYLIKNIDKKKVRKWWKDNVDKIKSDNNIKSQAFYIFLNYTYFQIVDLMNRPGFLGRYNDEEKYDMALNATLRLFERIERLDNYIPRSLSQYSRWEGAYQLFRVKRVEEEREKKEVDIDSLKFI